MPNDPEDSNNIKPNNQNPNNQNGVNNSNKDDFVDSSFLVQFKPGDKTESVADKLKESKEQAEKKAEPKTDDFGFKDEFDDFEFDSSISAFKPLNAQPEPAAPAPAPAPAAPAAPVEKPVEAKPAVASNEPVFPKDGGTFDKPVFAPKAPETPKEALPKFNDKDAGSKSTQPGSDKLFESGNGLDFATSEHDKKTSPFLNAEKPDIPAPDRVDIPRAEAPKAAPAPEKQKPIAPASKPQAQPSGYRPYPSANKAEIFTVEKTERQHEAMKEAEAVKPGAAQPKAEPDKNAAPAPVAPAPAKPAEPAKAAAVATAAAAATAAAVKPAAPASAPVKPSAQAPAPAPVKPSAPAAPVQAEPAAQPAPAAPVKPAAQAPAPAPVKPSAPAAPAKPVEKIKAPAETEMPHRPAAKAETKPEAKAAPASAPAPAPAPVKAPDQVRPGASTAKPAAQNEVYSPFEPKSKQPTAATRGVATQKTHHDASRNISPVTTVKKSKKHKKEPKSTKDPGLVGLITFLGIILLAIGVLWALDSTAGIRAIFGKKQVETIATVTTEKEIESSKEDFDATTTTEEVVATTTEATTESTTEATTATTTEETTETTTEATTTTTEATTESTTEATTTTTTEATRRTSATSSNATAEGDSINDFDMKINNFTPTAGGFKFDISLKNKSYYTANLPKSLKCLNIKLYSSSTITSVTSDSMVFTGDGVSYKGIPNEIAVAAGETYTFTVYVSTESSVTAYGYNYAYFDWYK